MARISKYVNDTTVQGNDRLVGSNIDGTTKNFAVEDIVAFTANTNAAGVIGQLPYVFVNSYFGGSSTQPGGSMAITDLVETSIQFIDVTTLRVSTFARGYDVDAITAITAFEGGNIIIANNQDPDAFAIYTCTAATVDPTDSNFYNLTLSYVSGTGSLIDSSYYSIASRSAGVSLGIDGQIPFTNATGDDLDYSSGLTYSGTELYAEGDLRLQLNGQGSWDYTIQAVDSNTANIGGPNRINYTSSYSDFSGSVYIATGGTSKVVSIGNDGGLGARLGVKGRGTTTQATFLLQNSADTELFKVLDNGTITDINGNTFHSLGTDGQIPFTNATGDDLDYSSSFTYTDANKQLNLIAETSANITPLLLSQENTSNQMEFQITSRNHIKWVGSQGTIYLSGRGNGLFIGGASTDASARLHVKGSGNTSATTALLVQNSDGDDMLKVTDDGLVTIPRTGTSLAIRNYISIDNAPGSILVGYDASAFYFAYGINKDIHVGSGNSGDVLYKGSGNWNIAASDLGAKLGVKGSGNTSATTALLVQNSDGDDMFKVADDKAIYALTDATSNYKTKITNRGVYFSRGSDGYFNSYILASTTPAPTVTIQAAGSVHIKSSAGNNSFDFNSTQFSSPYSVRSERYSCFSNKNMLITADPAAGSSNGVIVNIGSRNSSATQAIMSWKKGTYNTTTGTEIGRITPTGLSLGTTASTAFLHTAAATTAKASIRIEASASIDPTTPNSGDLWFDGTNLKFYDGTTTHNIV